MSDYNFMMESRLSPTQFRLVNEFSRIAYKEGINLYLVGGAVRDMTFGQAIVRDLDFAAEGDIQKILRHLLPGKNKKRTRESGKGGSAWATGAPELLSSRIDQKCGSAELCFGNGVRAGISALRQSPRARTQSRSALPEYSRKMWPH